MSPVKTAGYSPERGGKDGQVEEGQGKEASLCTVSRHGPTAILNPHHPHSLPRSVVAAWTGDGVIQSKWSTSSLWVLCALVFWGALDSFFKVR